MRIHGRQVMLQAPQERHICAAFRVGADEGNELCHDLQPTAIGDSAMEAVWLSK